MSLFTHTDAHLVVRLASRADFDVAARRMRKMLRTRKVQKERSSMVRTALELGRAGRVGEADRADRADRAMPAESARRAEVEAVRLQRLAVLSVMIFPVPHSYSLVVESAQSVSDPFLVGNLGRSNSEYQARLRTCLI